MSEQIRQDIITGSRRFSNYFWGIFLAIGGISFLLAGLSSYFKVNLLPVANPTELVFNTLIQRMRSQCFRAICQDGDSLLDCASGVLDDVTLDDVRSMYRHCGYK